MTTIADTIREEHAALMDSCGKPSYEQLEKQRNKMRDALLSISMGGESWKDCTRTARAALLAAGESV